MKVDLYIIAGQSNAEGNAKIETCPEELRDKNVYETVRYYAKRTFVSGKVAKMQNDFGPVRETLGAGDEERNIGPELGMANVLAPLYDGKERLAVIVKHAAGGTSLLLHEEHRANVFGDLAYDLGDKNRAKNRGTWYPEALEEAHVKAFGPGRPTGYLLRGLKNTLTDCVNDLIAKGIKKEDITFKGMAWMQGETDRKNFMDYRKAFSLLTEEVRQHVAALSDGRTTDLRIAVGEISETFNTADGESLAQNRMFIKMQNELAAEIPNMTTVPSGGFRITECENGKRVLGDFDPWHFKYSDEYRLGQMFAEALK